MNIKKSKIKNIIWNIIASKLPRDHDPEVLRIVLMINLFAIIGCFFVFPLGLVAFLNKNYVLFITDNIAGGFFILTIIWIRKTQNTKQIVNINAFLLASFFLFIIIDGGVNQTAFIWSLTYPVFTIFILGKRKGIITSGIFIIFVIVTFISGHFVVYISKYSIALIIRFIAVYSAITLFVFIMEKTRERVQGTLEKANLELQESLEEIKTLSGLLPICLKCKKIRDDKGYWNQIEGYIQKHSEAKFSHSMCPECSDEFYGNEEWYKNMKIRKEQKQ